MICVFTEEAVLALNSKSKAGWGSSECSRIKRHGFILFVSL